MEHLDSMYSCIAITEPASQLIIKYLHLFLVIYITRNIKVKVSVGNEMMWNYLEFIYSSQSHWMLPVMPTICVTIKHMTKDLSNILISIIFGKQSQSYEKTLVIKHKHLCRRFFTTVWFSLETGFKINVYF